jgi:hypothetical protein
MDMWFYSLEQIGLWELIIEEMSFIATNLSMKQTKVVKKE